MWGEHLSQFHTLHFLFSVSSKAYSVDSNSSNFAARSTASALLKSGSTRYSLHLLYYLLDYWKSKEVEETSAKVNICCELTLAHDVTIDGAFFHLVGKLSSQVHLCAAEYWQLVASCSCTNLS